MTIVTWLFQLLFIIVIFELILTNTEIEREERKRKYMLERERESNQEQREQCIRIIPMGEREECVLSNETRRERESDGEEEKRNGEPGEKE